MRGGCQFRICYWGARGAITTCLRPHEVFEKLVRSVAELLQRGALQRLAEERADEPTIRRRLEENLPFPLRSTYGGHTSCVEIETPDGLVILDAGSGFRGLGLELNRRWNAPGYQGPRSAHVFLTHAHMDHTHGTPFIDPFYDQRNDFKIWAPQSALDSLHAVLSPDSTMRSIFFATTYQHMAGIKQFQAIEAKRTIRIGQTRVSTHPLRHPGGCVAYRFERAGRRIVFASDHEHAETPDRALAKFAQGADLLYMDAQYLADEYQGRIGIADEPPAPRIGWGHSTVEQAVDTAIAAGARLLHLGHHEPKRGDEDLFALEQYARRRAAKTLTESGGRPEQCEVHVVQEGLNVEI
jgi:phosphoribosyl 1,2-cyclic phosphodiesterase